LNRAKKLSEIRDLDEKIEKEYEERKIAREKRYAPKGDAMLVNKNKHE